MDRTNYKALNVLLYEIGGRTVQLSIDCNTHIYEKEKEREHLRFFIT